MLLCLGNKNLVIQRNSAVIRVSDDVNTGVFHCIYGGCGIFFYGADAVAVVMDAGDGVVDAVQQVFRKINRSLIVQNIQFAAHDEFHSE